MKYEPNQAKWKVYILWKRDFCIVRFDLDFLLASFIQGYFIPLYKRSMRYIGPRGEKLSSRQGFYIKFFNDLNLRPSIIVLSHCNPFTQRKYVGEVWTNWARGEKICFGQAISDGQIDHYRAPAERDPYKFCYWLTTEIYFGLFNFIDKRASPCNYWNWRDLQFISISNQLQTFWMCLIFVSLKTI